MSTLEMKWKIVQSLDKLNEAQLAQILEKLTAGTDKNGHIKYNLEDHLSQVMTEDANLLKRLA